MNKVSEEFLEELKALLMRHDVEIEANGECGCATMHAWSYAVYRDNEIVRDCIDINLGSWIDGD